MENKKYYRNLNLIRVVACIAVLLYHLKILKGGFLAVIVFFVLSGYLSTNKALKSEKFSFKDYYKTRFMRLYLPVLVVVFLTIFALSFFENISWLNLKPETTSVLLGYNNFWQLNANLDYFARHIDSPFMHLWYIAILLQFELVFPFMFVALKKLKEKASKFFPIVITISLGLISMAFFYKSSLSNVMVAYYNTFARVFSLLFGVALGFIHSSYSLIFKKLKGKIVSKIIFSFYLIILVLMMIFVDANSNFFIPSMILATFITMRLIDYATIMVEELNIFDKFIKLLSSISYEIYLIQYPVIFIFEELEISNNLKIPGIILITIILSIIIHFVLDFKNNKIFKNIVRILILPIILYGAYLFIISQDHSEEMKKLEEQLNQNEKLIESKKEEYALKLKEEQEKWDSILNDLENGEEGIKELVSNLSIVGVGDSVMLGAVPNLYNRFKNSYFDAQISRTCYVANDILKELDRKKMLGDTIVFNFGANGDCSEANKEKILNIIGDRKLFWLTVTNDSRVHFNNKIKAFAAKHDNVYIIDWEAISKGHKEYFYSDGLHLPQAGRIAYTNAIYDAIYKVYLDEFNAKKEAILKEHDELLKSKISFYGNDLLTNAYDLLKADFEKASFTINNDFTYEELKSEIEKNIQEKTISYNVVLVFDSSFKIKKEEYIKIFELLKDNKVYVINMQKDALEFENENVTLINFYSDLKNNDLMADKVHLTDSGNKLLHDKLVEILK